MFESIQRPRRGRPRVLFLLSIAAHAAALALLVGAALWQIDKLEVADLPLLVAAGPGAPMSAGPEEEAEPERKQEEKKKRRVRTDLPRTDRSQAETAEDSSSGSGAGDGQDGGDGRGLGLFPCEEGGSCSVLDRPAEKAPPPRKQEEERIVLARMVEGARIRGNPRIEPPDSVRQAMVRLAQDRIEGRVKMCLDRAGNVRSLRILRSTGHGEYDQRLLAGMRSWGYRPYRLDSGEAVPVCTVVTFIYQVQ
ncbi:MAG TPA: energy transducer TonB [Kofleriaceae bacterium]|nr:energy transducer TonB [Kofleriaceae bacterium]